MPLHLPVSLKGTTVAIAICDRCKMKAYYDELVPDGNSPGLRVHPHCRDVKDPYRLPARNTENISLRYPRPELPQDEELTALVNEQMRPIDFPPEIAP